MKKTKKNSENDNAHSFEVGETGLVRGWLDKKTAERIARMSERQRRAFAVEAAECIRRLALGYTFKFRTLWLFEGQENLFDREAIGKAFMGKNDK